MVMKSSSAEEDYKSLFLMCAVSFAIDKTLRSWHPNEQKEQFSIAKV